MDLWLNTWIAFIFCVYQVRLINLILLLVQIVVLIWGDQTPRSRPVAIKLDSFRRLVDQRRLRNQWLVLTDRQSPHMNRVSLMRVVGLDGEGMELVLSQVVYVLKLLLQIIKTWSLIVHLAYIHLINRVVWIQLLWALNFKNLILQKCGTCLIDRCLEELLLIIVYRCLIRKLVIIGLILKSFLLYHISNCLSRFRRVVQDGNIRVDWRGVLYLVVVYWGLCHGWVHRSAVLRSLILKWRLKGGLPFLHHRVWGAIKFYLGSGLLECALLGSELVHEAGAELVCVHTSRWSWHLPTRKAIHFSTLTVHLWIFWWN